MIAAEYVPLYLLAIPFPWYLWPPLLYYLTLYFISYNVKKLSNDFPQMQMKDNGWPAHSLSSAPEEKLYL